MNIDSIVRLSSLAFAVVGFLYGIWQTISKSKVKSISKAQLARLNELELSVNKFDVIKGEIMRYIVEAEASNVPGVIKKMLVKSRVTSLCLLKGINATDEEIDVVIEEFIVFSKQVNNSPSEVPKNIETHSGNTAAVQEIKVNTGYAQEVRRE